MKTGRSKVKGTAYSNDALFYIQRTNRYALSLLASINTVFTQGVIEYNVGAKHVLINYSDKTWRKVCSVKFPVAAQTRQDFDETKFCVQDFLLDCFYTYEYPFIKQWVVTLKMLSLIMGVDFRSVFSEIDLLENAIVEGFVKMCSIGNTLAIDGKLKKSPGLKAMYEKVKESL